MKLVNIQIDEEDHKKFKSIIAGKGVKGKDVWGKLLTLYLKDPTIID